MRQKQHRSCGDSFLHGKGLEVSTQTIQGNLSNRVRTNNGRTTRILLHAMVQSRVSFPKVGGTLRWNVFATCGTCTTKMADGKTACEKSCGVTFVGLLIPFGAKVSWSRDPLKKRVSAASLRQQGASWNLHGLCPTCGEEEGQVTCSLRTAKTWITCQPSKIAPNSSKPRQSLVQGTPHTCCSWSSYVDRDVV